MTAPTPTPTSTPDSAPSPNRRRTVSRARRQPVTYVLLSLGVLLMAAPFLWMAISSFKTREDLSTSPPVWLPTQWTLDNFSRLLDRLDLPLYFLNSSVVAGFVTLSNLLCCSMVGYALAKLRFAGRGKVFALVLGALMVPANLMLLPLFVMMSKAQLLDSYAALTLPFAAQAFGVFLMRQFMQSVPDELLEAARLDGASEWYLYWRIALPLVKPGLATLAIFTFLGSWNNFMWPLIATNDPDKYTLPVALATFATDPNQAGGSNGVLMAGSFLVVLPVLFVFAVLQRHFTQSVATAGLK